MLTHHVHRGRHLKWSSESLEWKLDTRHQHPPTTCWILYCIPSKPVVLPARRVVDYPLNFDLCPMCPQTKVVGSGGYYGISHITEHDFLTTKEKCFLLNVPSSNSRIVYMVCTSPHERTVHLPTFLAQLRFQGKLPRSSGCFARPPQAGKMLDF